MPPPPHILLFTVVLVRIQARRWSCATGLVQRNRCYDEWVCPYATLWHASRVLLRVFRVGRGTAASACSASHRMQTESRLTERIDPRAQPPLFDAKRNQLQCTAAARSFTVSCHLLLSCLSGAQGTRTGWARRFVRRLRSPEKGAPRRSHAHAPTANHVASEVSLILGQKRLSCRDIRAGACRLPAFFLPWMSTAEETGRACCLAHRKAGLGV